MESSDENFKESEEAPNNQEEIPPNEEEIPPNEEENNAVALQDCQINPLQPEELEEKLAADENSFVTIAVHEEDDQSGEQVYGYLDTRSATLFVQNHLDGAPPRLYITQNEDGNEFIVVVSENGQTLEQSFPHNAVVQQDVVLESVSNLRNDNEGSPPALQYDETGDNVVASDVNIKSKTDCAGEDSDISENAVWAIRDNVPGQENSTEMVFIPAQSIISSQLLSDDDSNHRKLLHLSSIPHESSSSKSMSLLNKPLDATRNVSENSVIVTKHFSDVESPSEIEERGNDNINTPLSVDEDTSERLAQDSDQAGSQYSLYSGSRTIDNAVSVIHSPSSFNSLNGSSFTSLKGREFDERKEYNRENVSHLEDSYTGNSSPEQSFHLTSDNKLLIDEDSNTMSSQTSGLDLSKDSKVQYSTPACDAQFSDEELKIVQESPVPQGRIEEDSDISVDHVSSKSSSVIVAMDEESKGRMDVPDDESTLGKDDSSNAETTEMDISEREMQSNEEVLQPVREENLEFHEGNECAMEIDVPQEDAHKLDSVELQKSSEDTPFAYSDPLCDKIISNRNKSDMVSFNQECLLPKKKFRIQPDIEKEIAEICDSGNNFHNIVKEIDYESLSSKKSGNKEYGGEVKDLSRVHEEAESSIVFKEIDSDYLSDKKLQSKKENGYELHKDENIESSISFKEIDDDYLFVKKIQNQKENGDVQKEDVQNLDTELREYSDTGDGAKFTSNFTGIIKVSINSTDNSIAASEEKSIIGEPEIISEQGAVKNVSQVSMEDIIETSNDQSNHVKVTITPAQEKRNLDVFDLSPDDTFVLPPKITYTSRKRKRSPSPEEPNAQKVVNELFSNSGEIHDHIKDVNDVNSNSCELTNETDQSMQIDDDDFISPVNIKISANYTRKRKSMPPVVREVRTRSLRPRHLTTGNSSESDSKTESIVAVGKTNTENEANSEELNWGNILLSTSFQTPSDTHNSLDPKVPKKKSVAKLKKERVAKSSASKSEAQWEKFMKSSSPKKVKSYEKKIREKVKKQVRTLCNSERFISQFDKSPTELPSPRKRKSSKKEQESSIKKLASVSSSRSRRSTKIAEDEDLSSTVSGINDKQPTTLITASNNCLNTNNSSLNLRVSSGEVKDFNCSNCSFSTNKVNNLIMHMKFCAHKEPPGRLLDYSVNDMDRRQRIRGEDGMENCRDRSKSYLSNGSVKLHQ